MKKMIKAKPIVLFIIAVVALYVIIYVVPRLTGVLTFNYTVEYGELKISDETTGYIVRNEDVYITDNGGKTNYYIDEGTMVRKGTGVLEITDSSNSEVAARFNDIISRLGKNVIKTSEYKVEASGIVCYYCDGYEKKLTPSNMEDKSYTYYTKLGNDTTEKLNRSSVAKGEPVFKVVDRTTWYMVCFVDATSMDRYSEGQIVTVEFDDGSVDAEVYSIKKSGDKAKIIFSTNNYYEKFAQLRTAEVRIVTADNMGLIIDNSSIGTKDDKKGVYVKSKTGEYRFTPIRIISTDGKKSVISMNSFYDESGELVNTVKTYDDILKNAKK